MNIEHIPLVLLITLVVGILIIAVFCKKDGTKKHGVYDASNGLWIKGDDEK